MNLPVNRLSASVVRLCTRTIGRHALLEPYTRLFSTSTSRHKQDSRDLVVIGHRNPDTDAITAAIVYTHLLRQLQFKANAYRLGELNNETKFVLKAADVQQPDMLPDSLPDGTNVALVDHNESNACIDALSVFHFIPGVRVQVNNRWRIWTECVSLMWSIIINWATWLPPSLSTYVSSQSDALQPFWPNSTVNIRWTSLRKWRSSWPAPFSATHFTFGKIRRFFPSRWPALNGVFSFQDLPRPRMTIAKRWSIFFQ